MRYISTQKEAEKLLNKIAKYVSVETFEPFYFDASFDKKRSTPQNAYYHGVIVQKQLGYFKDAPLLLIEYLVRALKCTGITEDLIHSINKIMHNKGKSTTSLSVDNFVEDFGNPIREDMLHHCGVDIPLPNDNDLLEAFNQYEQRKGA